MNTSTLRSLFVCALLAIVVLPGCGDSGRPDSAAQEHDEHDDADTDRVEIPATVRSNLGITFVGVELRRIEQTLRAPGRFEYLPTARREYRTMLPGRVELLVDQFDRVGAGTPLYRIDSPAWRELQQELTLAESSIQRLQTRLDSFGPLREAHRAHEDQLQQIIAIRHERVEQLEGVAEAGGGRLRELIEARDRVSTAEADLAEVLEKEAELGADESETRAGLTAARAGRDLLLDTLSSLVLEPVDALVVETDTPSGPRPRWRSMGDIVVRAEEPGVVEMIGLTNGAWATQETSVLTVVHPDRLRFRASALQSDLGVLREGLEGRIVPPTPTAAGSAVPLQDTMSGSIALGLTANANDRTLELYVVPSSLSEWARAGVSAQLEVVTDSTVDAVPAIPLAAVQRDGLTPIIFKRAPDDPDAVIRTVATFGADDGRWVEVLNGVGVGDEVVLDGAFQLMLGTSGSAQRGGHFHPDGTFHDGED